MIRTLLTTTALAALLSTGAIAQTTTTTPMTTNGAATTSTGARAPIVMSEGYAAIDGDNLASRVLGATVYSSVAENAENIGEINDLVLDSSGDIVAAVVGVGGFLGAGEKNVAVSYSELKWSTAFDGTWRYVLDTTADLLKAAPDFVYDDETAADQAANVDENNTQVADPAVTTDAPMAGNSAAPLDRSAMTALDAGALTSEELQGTAVYGLNDEKIGTIGDFMLNADGKIDAVIVDVGGFLGLGKKPVAVGFVDLAFSADANNNRYLFINTTKEQLEAQPEFNRDTYTNERMTQRLIVKP